MCWKSLHLTNEIIFFHGQAIDQDKADMLNLSEMFGKMLAVVDQFRRLKLDQYECVALKVIILICPGMNGIGNLLNFFLRISELYFPLLSPGVFCVLTMFEQSLVYM